VPWPDPIVLAYVCDGATEDEMAMVTGAADRCAEPLFRELSAAVRNRTGGLDGGDSMFLLLPKTIHSGHFAYAAASDKLLGGQTASTLLFFWKASLSIELPLTAHGPIHPQVSSRPQPLVNQVIMVR
jgi:hypothetical protein